MIYRSMLRIDTHEDVIILSLVYSKKLFIPIFTSLSDQRRDDDVMVIKKGMNRQINNQID